LVLFRERIEKLKKNPQAKGLAYSAGPSIPSIWVTSGVQKKFGRHSGSRRLFSSLPLFHPIR